MDEKVLNYYETFEEFPDGTLVVNKDSNYYYIRIGIKNYVAIEKIESIECDIDSKTTSIKNYCDVVDGTTILKITEMNDGSISKEPGNYVKIYMLNELLNVQGNSIYALKLDDVKTLCGFKEEKSNDPRQYYF